MTPYAVLLVKPNDGDKVIRAAYHRLATLSHPDTQPVKDTPGPLWHAATEAYGAIKTEALRAAWASRAALRAGRCASCDGVGVVGSRLGGKQLRLCSACEGRGAGR
jgi:DnaJ-class molecular chaperone